MSGLRDGIQDRGGNVQVLNDVGLAKSYLEDTGNKVDEVICGTFGGEVDGPWRTVREAAAERRFTLLTPVGSGISPQQVEILNQHGIGVLDKTDFWPGFDRFLDQRFQLRGPNPELKIR